MASSIFRRTRPFTLAVLEPGQPTSVTEWDGLEKMIVRTEESDMGRRWCPRPSTPMACVLKRREEFRRKARSRPAARRQSCIRVSRKPCNGADAYSPCMHRADARTVSFSWIVVTADEARFYYAPEPPCRHSQGEQLLLGRAA